MNERRLVATQEVDRSRSVSSPEVVRKALGGNQGMHGVSCGPEFQGGLLGRTRWVGCGSDYSCSHLPPRPLIVAVGIVCVSVAATCSVFLTLWLFFGA